MKNLITSILFTFSATTAVADLTPTIDDLQSISLRSERAVESRDVHYPNYRMGGGTGATRPLVDCFVIDILDSDREPNLALKQKVADQIQVSQGFRHDDNSFIELSASVQRDKIVYKILPQNFFVTNFKVKSRDGRSLSEVISEIVLPPVGANMPAPVNLLYVRACRL